MSYEENNKRGGDRSPSSGVGLDYQALGVDGGVPKPTREVTASEYAGPSSVCTTASNPSCTTGGRTFRWDNMPKERSVLLNRYRFCSSRVD